MSIIGSALANLNLALYLNTPLMVFWWRFAVLMSEEDSHSRYYKSKMRFCPCSMCSHSLLRNGCVMTRHSKSGVPVTMVVQPLKHKCCRRRRVKFIVHSRDSRRVISLLLMLAGDVETNPGPLGNGMGNATTNTFLCKGLYCSKLVLLIEGCNFLAYVRSCSTKHYGDFQPMSLVLQLNPS